MKQLIAVCILYFIPLMSSAQILFSEIAWMGTDDDANNEWIEIYNFSDTSTDLTGWKLESDDGAISISFTGTLSPHAVAVLERTDDDTLPGVTAFLTYTGGLSNEGRTLTIKDSTDTVSDQAIGGTNWSTIGGSNTVPKKTAQRTRTGSWVTAAPTPGAQNAEVNDVVHTDTTTQTTETDNTSEKKSETQKSSGGGSSKKRAQEASLPGVLTLAIDAPTTAYVNQPILFTAEPSGIGSTLAASLKYEWNFGDMHTDSGRTVTHTFAFPGTYLVYGAGSYAKQHAYAQHEITVLPTAITLKRTQEGNVMITNTSSHDIEVSGFKLAGSNQLVFPDHSFIKGNGSITISGDRVGNTAVSLYDSARTLVASHGGEPAQVPTVVTRRAPVPQQTVAATRSTADTNIPPVPEVKNTEVTNSDVPKESVIEIGSREPEKSQGGLIARFLRKIGSLFGS